MFIPTLTGLSGDDVPSKKPDPMIYTLAAEKLGLRPEECVVVEDSNIGLEAARGAGMRCIITYTEATKDQASGGQQGGEEGGGHMRRVDLGRSGWFEIVALVQD